MRFAPWRLAFPAQAQQQKNVPRVGLLMSSSTAETAPFIEAFRQGLRDLGYVDGKNIVLEIRGGEANPDRVSDLAAELIALKVEILSREGALRSVLQ
jgi:putative tryptophan/tyrosine transport system substrate-binding protein